MEYQDQKISTGSSRLLKKETFDKDQFMVKNMQFNAAYKLYIKKENINEKSLKDQILQD